MDISDNFNRILSRAHRAWRCPHLTPAGFRRSGNLLCIRAWFISFF
ncbi:Uncharacterized protein ChrSV_4381 [Chromobacterium vaccinii]|nr:Uncharacterized protein ChrSW_4381 [Chromobacterium vaccinii]QND91837.1 Uncharacterized protein ChrSV_4381 [Chromobacterium vaccinii]